MVYLSQKPSIYRRNLVLRMGIACLGPEITAVATKALVARLPARRRRACACLRERLVLILVLVAFCLGLGSTPHTLNVADKTFCLQNVLFDASIMHCGPSC